MSLSSRSLCYFRRFYRLNPALKRSFCSSTQFENLTIDSLLKENQTLQNRIFALEEENKKLRENYVSKEDIIISSELIGLTFHAGELVGEYVGDIFYEADKKGVEPFSEGVKYVYQTVCGEYDVIFNDPRLSWKF